MTKAVSLSICLVILLASAAQLRAQTNATDLAISRAVQDQAYTIVLRQKLEDAKTAAASGDLAGAAKIYEEAYAVSQQIGSGIDVETAQAMSGLTTTRLTLAKQSQARGDLQVADREISRVLKVDPKNADALAMKKQNDEMIAAQVGTVPDRQTTERIPAVQNDKTQAATLVQDGKLLYEMGKLEEADVKLSEALKLDPDNEAAFYYLNLVQQAGYNRGEHAHTTATTTMMTDVEKDWVKPPETVTVPSVPNPYATNQLIYTGPGRTEIMNKLDTYRLSVSYDPAVPLREVIRDLRQKIQAMDPRKKPMNININNNPPPPPAATATAPGGLPPGFGGATQIDPTTGLPLTPNPAAGGGGGGGEAVDIGSSLVSLTLDDVRLADVLDAICSVDNDPNHSDQRVKYSITDYGIVFSAKGSDQVALSERTFKVDPDTFYSGLQGVSETTFGSTGNNSGGNSGGGNNSGGNGSSGSTVAIVDMVGGGFGGGGVGGGRGNNNGGGGVGGGIGNNGGGGGRGGNAGGGGGNAAGGGGAGTVGDGGLSFINPRTPTSDVSDAARTYFNTLGIDMTSPAALAAGKSVVFNDKLGLLFVRATDQDLDTIERVIEALNQVAPQVHVSSRFIEMQQTDSKALGFDWYLGQFNLGNSVVGTGGSSPSLTVPTSAANPLGAFPGNTASSIVASSANDQLITAGLQNSAPALATFTGILTDPNFRAVIHALEQRGGTETLGEPSVTTTSGRQVQIRATKLINVITGFSFNNGTGANGATAATASGTTGGTVVNQAGASSVSPSTEQVETGPTLDVIPYVLSDGYTINMALIPSDTEFSGYDTISATEIPGFNPGAALAGIANGTTLPVALPDFTVRQVIASVNVWDHQTVVLGGLITSTIQTSKDKVPFIGDLPFVGRLFQSQSKSETKDNLMVFVTPTIVDPAGNRVHSDDELPFAQTAIPVQPVK